MHLYCLRIRVFVESTSNRIMKPSQINSTLLLHCIPTVFEQTTQFWFILVYLM